MQGDRQAVELLNRVLRNELTSINQYFLHARMLRNWGLGKLNEKEYAESIDEMKHADRLIERILFLEGLPNLQDPGKLRIGEDVPEILRNDLALEAQARETLLEAIGWCESNGDYVSRRLFDAILEDEEAHIDWLETQLELIGKLGLDNYLQSQL